MEETKKTIAGGIAKDFVNAFDALQREADANAREKGFWDRDVNDGEQFALMHSELSEGLDFLRQGNGQSDHIPDFLGVEEELADVVIRIMSYAGNKGLRISEALVAKMNYNYGRSRMHGGKKF